MAVILLAAAAQRSPADDAVPKAQPATRYEAMAARSPFTVPTVTPVATPPPAPAGPHWWDQMFLTSLMERNGTYFATVVDRASNKHYLLELNKLDEDSQFVLTAVSWNEQGNQSTVVVRRGDEAAPPLRFDASATPVAPAYAPQPSLEDNARLKAAAANNPPPPSNPSTRRGTVFTGP